MAIYIHVEVLQIHIRINHKERKCVHICLENRLAFGRTVDALYSKYLFTDNNSLRTAVYLYINI